MKKLLILLFMSLLVLFGCTSKSEDLEEYDYAFYMPWSPSAYVNESTFPAMVEEYTNKTVKYVFPQTDKDIDILLTDLALQTPYSAVKVPPEDFAKVMDNDVALNIAPYLEEYGENIVNGIPEEVWNLMTDSSGAIYGIPSLSITPTTTSFIVYRKDVLEELNLEVPKTTDDLLNAVCSAVGSVPTPYGMSHESPIYDAQLLAAFDIPYLWNETDSEYVYVGEDENYIEFLNYIKSIYDCGGYGLDFETISNDVKVERFINGEVLFMSSDITELENIANSLEVTGQNFYDVVGFLPPLTNSNTNEKAKVKVTGPQIEYITFIPVYMEEYVIDIISFINMLLEPEFYEMVMFGTEATKGTVWDIADNGVKYIIPGTDTDAMEVMLADFFLIGGNYAYMYESYLAQIEELEKIIESGNYSYEQYLLYVNQIYVEEAIYNPVNYVPYDFDIYVSQKYMRNELAKYTNMYTINKKNITDLQAFLDKQYESFEIEHMTNLVNEYN